MVVQLTTPFIHTVAMAHPDKIAKGIQPCHTWQGNNSLKTSQRKKTNGCIKEQKFLWGHITHSY